VLFGTSGSDANDMEPAVLTPRRLQRGQAGVLRRARRHQSRRRQVRAKSFAQRPS